MTHVLRGRRPSAAMSVAIVALSGNRLRNRSVQGAKIKLSSLGTVPNARHAVSADTASTAAAAPAAS